MPSEVLAYFKSCSKCQKINYSNSHSVAPLKPFVVNRCGQLWGLDFKGPLKQTLNGNVYIILGVDAQCKIVEAAATKSFDITERVNKVIKPGLAKYVDRDHRNWDVYLQMSVSAYNNTLHGSIGMTPFEAHYGRPSTQVADVVMNNQLPRSTQYKDVNEYIVELRKTAEYTQRQIKERKEKAQKKQKAYYDKFVKVNREYVVGNKVKLINFRHKMVLSAAFEDKFLGPFTIVRILDNLRFVIVDNNGKEDVVHYNRLEHFTERTNFVSFESENLISTPEDTATLVWNSNDEQDLVVQA